MRNGGFRILHFAFCTFHFALPQRRPRAPPFVSRPPQKKRWTTAPQTPQINSLSVNALKYLSLGLLLLLAGCASKDNSKRNAGPPWYAPDVDSEDRKFFYDSFVH